MLSNSNKQLGFSTSWFLKSSTMLIFRVLLIKHIACNSKSTNLDVSLQLFRAITMVIGDGDCEDIFPLLWFFLTQLLAVDVLKPLCECFSAFWQENLGNETLEIRIF